MRELKLKQGLRFGQLSDAAVERVCSSVTSVTQLTSLDLFDMRQLGLDAVDRHLLDLIRLETIADGATDAKGAVRLLETKLRERSKEVEHLESVSSALRVEKEQL